MPLRTHLSHRPLRNGLRVVALLLALCVVALFVIAVGLQPDARGIGTHQQLGLPPCSIRMIFGIRCPLCGMTTSWAHLLRGNFAEAVRCNLAGTMLAGLAAASLVPLTRMTYRGQLPGRRETNAATAALIVILALAAAQWIYRVGF